MSDFSSWDVKILGIDINTSSLDKAVRAKYSPWSLRDTSEHIRHQLFKSENKEFVLNDHIRNMVTFEERNLIEEDESFWRPGIFDVIFCRNVLMYFSTETIRTVISRMAQSLAPGGFLFLGPVETLRGISQKFRLCHTHETFYYQYRGVEKEPLPQNFIPMRSGNPWHDEPLTPAVDPDATWVDVICRASERIAKLIPGVILENPQSSSFVGTSKEVKTDAGYFTANTDLELARDLFKQERFEDAMVALQKAPLELETNPDVCLLRAAVLTNRGNILEAEKVCERVLQLNELNAGAHYLKALCREHSNDRASAIEQDKIAIYLDSNFAMPHLHLGLLAKQTGDSQTAKSELAQAINLLNSEDASRMLLFGGGFTREALISLCQAELKALEAR